MLCAVVAAQLQETWLAKHFDVRGDRSTHYGAPPASGTHLCPWLRCRLRERGSVSAASASRIRC
jgi:hypothetical protein